MAGSRAARAGEPLGVHLERVANTITLKVVGHMTADDGITSAARLAHLIGSDRVVFVGDLRLMEGYDRQAREAWQTAFKKLRDHFECIYICGAGPVLRMAATAVALYAGIPMRVADSPERIPNR